MHHSHGGLSGIYAVTLPPLSTLPSWSRASLHHKPKHPLQPDKLRPLATCTVSTVKGEAQLSPSTSGSSNSSDKEENTLHVIEVYKQRVKYLSNNIDFLKEEHGKILKSLHDEIERLKYENKDMKFKLIISDSGSNSWMQEKTKREHKETKSAVSDTSSRRISNKTNEDEINSLKENLSYEKNKNRILKNQMEDLTTKHDQPASVDGLPGTIEECHTLISSLKAQNAIQSKEVGYLSSQLDEVFSDAKWKSSQTDLIAANAVTEVESGGTSLPALRPSLQSKVVHRARRQQTIAKEKYRNDILKHS